MMTSTEIELIGSIYALYGYECVHWLKQEDIAYTRSSSKTWKMSKDSPLSFTLLRFRPCLVNLLPSLAGFISFHEAELSEEQTSVILRKLDHINRRTRKLLTIAASIEAVVLLVLVPATVAAHLLRYSWVPLLLLTSISHIATAFLFLQNLRFWQKDRQQTLKDFLAVCVNPLAAIRSGDILTQKMFGALKTYKPCPRVARIQTPMYP